jgi:3-methylcrotonyl-CoA carboxylase alpha subunit
MRHRYQSGERSLEVEVRQQPSDLLVQVDGQPLRCSVLRTEPDYLVLQLGTQIVRARITQRGPAEWLIDLDGSSHRVREVGTAGSISTVAAAAGRLVAPIPGKLVQLEVKRGDPVRQGQVVAILESMKMQTELRAPCSGRVSRTSAAVGALVQPGEEILLVEPGD